MIVRFLAAAFAGLILMTTPVMAQGLSDPRDAAKVFIDATAAGDADAIASLYTPEALLLPPNAPAIHGRDAIRAVFQNNFALGPNAIEFGNYKLDISGNRASLIWNWRSIINRTNGEPIRVLGRSSLYFKKTEDAGWLIDIDMFQPGQYAPPAK